MPLLHFISGLLHSSLDDRCTGEIFERFESGACIRSLVMILVASVLGLSLGKHIFRSHSIRKHEPSALALCHVAVSGPKSTEGVSFEKFAIFFFLGVIGSESANDALVECTA